MTTFPKKVKLVEVGPRDGLQNEDLFVPTKSKIAFINQLSETGLTFIESGSFVSPLAIPQLADSDLVIANINKKPGICYPALVPNLKGLERALAAGANDIAIFASASESFSQKNINCSIKESLKRFEQVMLKLQPHQLPVRAYISCVLGCPYEGPIKAKAVASLAKELLALGVNELSLGDTIGIGTPLNTTHLIDEVTKYCPIEKVAMHFHNTYGQALANIYASLQSGIHIFDSAVAGLGGCPYAKGATGNVASEDVLYLMNGLGIETGVDLLKLVHVGKFICDTLGRKNQSFVSNALLSH